MNLFVYSRFSHRSVAEAQICGFVDSSRSIVFAPCETYTRPILLFHEQWQNGQVKEAESHHDSDLSTPEPAEKSKRRRPSRLLVVSVALAIGAVVAGLAVLSRADTSVRVPDLIGTAADPVGDNLTFTADTVGLTLDVINVTDCQVRDANLVVMTLAPEREPRPGHWLPLKSADSRAETANAHEGADARGGQPDVPVSRSM